MVQQQPLAVRMRPEKLSDFVGQKHLMASTTPFRQAIEQSRLHAMVLWGPPGVGKTTLASLLAKHVQAELYSLSAVTAGAKELRAVAQEATEHRKQGIKTLLLLDEIHRLNKAQQDLLLPHVEAGLYILLGATTENPSFALNNALLSRVQVYPLKPLDFLDLDLILTRALTDPHNGYGKYQISLTKTAREILLNYADGDGRQLLNMLQVACDLVSDKSVPVIISETTLAEVVVHRPRRFDRHGDHFYDQISALHKAVRGSAPDAALYWFARMLDGGCDPLYIARRVVRMASEDIGNADPRGLTLSLDAWDTQHRLGSPEGELAIAQAIVYLACAPKSNAVYLAWKAAQKLVANNGTAPVPLHLRNAPTKLMQQMGYGKSYQYAHDYPMGYVPGENYFPTKVTQQQFYFPTERGLEQRIKQRLEQFKQLDAASEWQREEENS